MRFNPGARLDTSQVRDVRGRGGGGGIGLGGIGMARGGGGLGLLVVLGIVIFNLIGGGGGGGSAGSVLGSMLNGGSGAPVKADNSTLRQNCQTGEDANSNADCALVAIINSIQSFWDNEFAESGTTYQPTTTTWFTGAVSTGCGRAGSGVGPFYCPADKGVYVDLSFFQQLETQFNANDELFTQAYVIAHEYGHHVQNLLGTSQRVGRESGPESGAVRLELQADCYAGAWAHNATTVPGADGRILITDITQADIDAALEAAGRIGDDYIQSELGDGSPDPESYTHGTSEQRQQWFAAGYRTGDPAQCDTFDTADLG